MHDPSTVGILQRLLRLMTMGRRWFSDRAVDATRRALSSGVGTAPDPDFRLAIQQYSPYTLTRKPRVDC